MTGPGRAPTVVITGASSGIGREAAGALAAGGARIAVVGRDPERTRAVAAEVAGEAFLADFDRLDDVRALAEHLLARYDRIDVLANNAGGLVPRRARTVDGHERTIQSNHLAPFLLTNLLLPRLEQSAARVVSTSSVLNRIGALRVDDLDRSHAPWLGGWPPTAPRSSQPSCSPRSSRGVRRSRRTRSTPGWSRPGSAPARR